MRRGTNRITFRLSDTEFQRYGRLIGSASMVKTWSKLIRKALWEYCERYHGAKQPLGTTPLSASDTQCDTHAKGACVPLLPRKPSRAEEKLKKVFGPVNIMGRRVAKRGKKTKVK
jgi:hypothetical protein